MASEHRRGLLPEKYFRWRSGEITRLEAFCDVVFGFALTLLVVYGLALRWRRPLTAQGFATGWLAFAGFAAGGAVLCWVLAALLSFRLLPLGPALFEAALATALYPALAIPLIRAHRTVADPERA